MWLAILITFAGSFISGCSERHKEQVQTTPPRTETPGDLTTETTPEPEPPVETELEEPKLQTFDAITKVEEFRDILQCHSDINETRCPIPYKPQALMQLELAEESDCFLGESFGFDANTHEIWALGCEAVVDIRLRNEVDELTYNSFDSQYLCFAANPDKPTIIWHLPDFTESQCVSEPTQLRTWAPCFGCEVKSQRPLVTMDVNTYRVDHRRYRCDSNLCRFAVFKDGEVKEFTQENGWLTRGTYGKAVGEEIQQLLLNLEGSAINLDHEVTDPACLHHYVQLELGAFHPDTGEYFPLRRSTSCRGRASTLLTYPGVELERQISRILSTRYPETLPWQQYQSDFKSTRDVDPLLVFISNPDGNESCSHQLCLVVTKTGAVKLRTEGIEEWRHLGLLPEGKVWEELEKTANLSRDYALEADELTLITSGLPFKQVENLIYKKAFQSTLEISPGTYTLTTPEGECLDVKWNVQEAGHPVISFACNGQENQNFKFEPVYRAEKSWFQIKPLHTLDLDYCWQLKGLSMITGPCLGTEKEYFNLTKNPSGRIVFQQTDGTPISLQNGALISGFLLSEFGMKTSQVLGE